MSINKIIIVADILRHKDGQDGNADMFYGFLSGIFSRISNLGIKCFNKEETTEMQKQIYAAYGFDIESENVEFSIFGGVPAEMWKELCFAQPNEELLNIIRHYFSDSLVICREPSPILIKAFEMLNIPYVELAIHSARYLDDLIMGIKSNDLSVYEKLKKYEIDKEEFYFYADLLKAEAMRKYSLSYNPFAKNSAVFFAQTPVDRSLLDFDNKCIVSFFDYQNEFKELTQKYNKVYYKSHPHYINEEVLCYLKKFDNVEVLSNDINTYDLLSLPNIKCFAAISSGTLNEARYFGKEVKSFLGQPYHYSDEIEDKNLLDHKKHYISISKHYLSAAFWADILSDLIDVKAVSQIDVTKMSNKFRRMIGTSWGYNDNDSQYFEDKNKKDYEKINNNLTNLEQNINFVKNEVYEMKKEKEKEKVIKKLLKEIFSLTYKKNNSFEMSVLGFKIRKKLSKNFNMNPEKIRLIEIETFSYCNRRCWFCPNSIIDRHSKNIYMKEDLYLNILEDLRKINYSSILTFSRYNEPLADKIILKRIKQAREILPNSILSTNTNGDFISKEYLDELKESGLNKLNIQCYLNEKEDFNFSLIKDKFDKMSKNLGLEYTTLAKNSNIYEIKFNYHDMEVIMYARNFRETGNNRGGSIDTLPIKKRCAPCFIPFTNMYIDHNGKVLPCCNFRSDIEQHKKFIIGDVNKKSILKIFNDIPVKKLRKNLVLNPIPIKECSECIFEEDYKIDF